MKIYVSAELDKIMRYGISNIKFEWTDAYRRTRPKVMTEISIKNTFRTADLISLNHRKVLNETPEFNEADIDSDKEINDASAPVKTVSIR